MQEGLDYTLFRPFNWIGPKLDNVFEAKEGSSRLFTQFISNVIFQKPIQLVDGGKQSRSFTFIDDGVEGDLMTVEIEQELEEPFPVRLDRLLEEDLCDAAVVPGGDGELQLVALLPGHRGWERPHDGVAMRLGELDDVLRQELAMSASRLAARQRPAIGPPLDGGLGDADERGDFLCGERRIGHERRYDLCDLN